MALLEALAMLALQVILETQELMEQVVMVAQQVAQEIQEQLVMLVLLVEAVVAEVVETVMVAEGHQETQEADLEVVLADQVGVV